MKVQGENAAANGAAAGGGGGGYLDRQGDRQPKQGKVARAGLSFASIYLFAASPHRLRKTKITLELPFSASSRIRLAMP